MSAETLRAAALMMRERAEEAAGTGGSSGPWCPDWTFTAIRHVQRNCDIDCPTHDEDDQFDASCDSFGRYAGYHIASWHPTVALTVADWLDGVAILLEAREDDEWFDLDGDPISPEDTHAIGAALTVARTYLGESA